MGTIKAGKADLNELHTAGKAVVGGDLTVNGRTDAMGELHAAQNITVDGDLTVNGVNTNSRLIVHGASQFEERVNANGDLHVDGASVFLGRVNANGLLSVRNQGQQLMHVS
ncbi:hypothetical protein [Kitasatospora sp. NPDC017646]|uniref:hypothetical protein n=1 Tax=Kitasatospora sp. NPDC017646 TaxID=3364024 RepID=UPI0037AD82DE